VTVYTTLSDYRNKHNVNILWYKSSCNCLDQTVMRVDESWWKLPRSVAFDRQLSLILVHSRRLWTGSNFDESSCYARGNIQSTLVQLLFSFDRGMRVEKTLMQTLNSHQLSFSFELPHERLSLETSKFLNKSNEIYDNLRRFKTLWCNIQNTIRYMMIKYARGPNSRGESKSTSE
jgi:hypothetical protein